MPNEKINMVYNSASVRMALLVLLISSYLLLIYDTAEAKPLLPIPLPKKSPITVSYNVCFADILLVLLGSSTLRRCCSSKICLSSTQLAAFTSSGMYYPKYWSSEVHYQLNSCTETFWYLSMRELLCWQAG